MRPGELALVEFGKERALVQLPKALDAKHKLIFFFHGRGVDASTCNFTLDEFAEFRRMASEKEYTVIVPDYGSDCWMNAGAEAVVLRLLSAFRSEMNVDLEKICVMGVSMGGAAALTFAARHPNKVSAVCDIMGVTDFARFYNESPYYHDSVGMAYGGSPDEVPEVYRERSPIHHVDKLSRVPVLIIHGDSDDLVPPSNSESLFQALKDAGGDAELIMVPRVGHDNSIISRLEYRIFDLFESTLVD